MKKLLLLLSFVSFLSAFSQQVSVISTQVCFGQVTALAGTSTLPISSITSWNWDLNNDGVFNDASGQEVSYVFQKGDTNLVSLKITLSAGGADSIMKVKVVVNPAPNVNFQANNLCETQAATYINLSTISTGSIVQAVWDFNNDGIPDATGDTTHYTCGVAQIYATRLTCTSNLGCSAFALKTTEVFPKPLAGFSASHTCEQSPTEFANSTQLKGDGISYSLWHFGDGGQALNSGDTSHTYASAGVYSPWLVVVSDHGCKDTARQSITINTNPKVLFAFSGDTLMPVGSSIAITGSSPTGIAYKWSNGSTQPSISVSDSGTYTLVVTDGYGCSSSKTAHIALLNATESAVVSNGVQLESTILTPNGDGINDYLLVRDLVDYTSCEIVVYDRWNVLVYSNSNYKNDWAGTNNGKALEAGAYYYYIRCDQNKVAKGVINLLR